MSYQRNRNRTQTIKVVFPDGSNRSYPLSNEIMKTLQSCLPEELTNCQYFIGDHAIDIIGFINGEVQVIRINLDELFEKIRNGEWRELSDDDMFVELNNREKTYKGRDDHVIVYGKITFVGQPKANQRNARWAKFDVIRQYPNGVGLTNGDVIWMKQPQDANFDLAGFVGQVVRICGSIEDNKWMHCIRSIKAPRDTEIITNVTESRRRAAFQRQ